LCGFYSRERLGASCERSRSRVMTLSEAVFFFFFFAWTLLLISVDYRASSGTRVDPVGQVF
jgi:hypothetical protein